MKPTVNLSSKYIKRENEYAWTSFLGILLATFFSTNLYILWPGQMTPDSHTQYEMALSGNYNDHHPPLMSVLWGIFNHIHSGSGLLFLFHLLLLYSASTLLICSTKDKIAQLLFLALPLLPPVSFYSSMIWKDVGFAAAYTCAFALLSYYSMQEKKVTIARIISVLLLIWYGTSIKFQAQFALPFLLLLFSYWCTNCRWQVKTIVRSILYTVLMLGFIRTVDLALIGKSGSLHSWQNVRLYDIAGIFKLTGRNFFPKFVKMHERYSEAEVTSRFNYERVDDLTGTQEAPLVLGSNQTERDALQSAWLNAIMHEPIAYLTHRWNIFRRTISILPLERFAQLDLSNYEGLRIIRNLKNTADTAQTLNKSKQGYAHRATHFFFMLVNTARSLSRLIIWLPVLILYLFLALFLGKKSKASAPLLCISLASIAFLGALFFLTMASAIRYVYLVFCLIHSSHGLAYLAIRNRVSS